MALRKLNKPSDQRKELFRGLLKSLFKHEKIETTETRAKEIRPLAEKLITASKEDTMHARLTVAKHLNDKDAVKKLFETIGPRYKERNGGYTRIIKKGPRRGDSTPMALIELVEE